MAKIEMDISEYEAMKEIKIESCGSCPFFELYPIGDYCPVCNITDSEAIFKEPMTFDEIESLGVHENCPIKNGIILRT